MKAVVLQVDAHETNRPNLFFEMGAALAMGKPFVFVRSEDLSVSELPPALRNRKFLVKGSPEATAQALIQAVAA